MLPSLVGASASGNANLRVQLESARLNAALNVPMPSTRSTCRSLSLFELASRLSLAVDADSTGTSASTAAFTSSVVKSRSARRFFVRGSTVA